MQMMQHMQTSRYGKTLMEMDICHDELFTLQEAGIASINLTHTDTNAMIPMAIPSYNKDHSQKQIIPQDR